MEYNEVRAELRRVAWIDHKSKPAQRAFVRGGGAWADWQAGQALRLNGLLAELWLKAPTMNGRKNKGFVPNIKFVDCELTSTGKAAFKAWDFGDDDAISFIERMGEEGYKLGARYDRANGAWIVSCTCAEVGHPNYGYCLSARGRSWLHGFSVLAYKHVELLSGDWTTSGGAGDEDSGWG